ncbi:MAG: zinc-binding dehydrogenase [Mariprofundales bacterium]|nr:zinc-binding dehydrogenase [Mariprofundales bacterium]
MEQRKLAVMVSDLFALERVADAHRQIEAGHTVGKLVIDLIGGG